MFSIKHLLPNTLNYTTQGKRPNSRLAPLSCKRVSKTQGKRPRSPSPSSSSSSMSDDDGLPNSRLAPLDYLQEHPAIKNEFEEYKQTKGMSKCFGRYLRKLKKKMDRL